MIVLVESHAREHAPRQPDTAVPEAGARWGRAAAFGFDRTDAEAENEARGGISEVARSQTPVSVKLWNLSPVWRAYDVVKVPSGEDPRQTTEAR